MTDVNNELTTKTYDGLGRLTAAWSPLHSQAASASADAKFVYAVSNTAPTAVTSSALRQDGLYNSDVKLYDGQLRLIQDQSVTRSGAGGRLLTDTHYDSLGQTVKTTAAYYDSSTNPTASIFVPANDSKVPAETESFFDGLGRPARSLFVAGGVNQWSTLTAYPGVDQTDVTPLAGGTATSTFTDALGRKTASWSYGSVTAPTDNAADAVITTYTHTPSGKTSTITDAAGDVWRYGYDLHDRQTALTDPAATASDRRTYSPGGELLSVTDARGTQLTFAYDSLARQTAEYDTTAAAASASDQLGAWTYDTLAKGQLTSQTRYTNGASDPTHAYTLATLGYTPLYQSTGTKVSIPSAEGALAGTYQSTTQYSAATSLISGLQYVAEAGLPREQVNYSYDLSESLSGFGGTFTYLNAVSYDALGDVLQTNFGTFGKQLARTQTYDLPTGRTLTQSDALQTLSSPLDSTAYTYTRSGSTTSVATSLNGVSTADTQCFAYDHLQRLLGAWTYTGGVNSPTSGQVMGIGGCTDTAPTAGKVTGGPAPYWESFVYDAIGNRVGTTNHDTSVSGTINDVVQSMTFNGYNASTGTDTAASQPAAVQSLTTRTASASTTASYHYDAAGNTTSRTGQSFTYDAEGRPASVTDAATGTTSSYLYAADGSLLIQRDPASSQVILYLPYAEEVHLDTAGGTLSGLRSYAASPDGVVIVRSSTGTVTYELTDSRDTALTSVDASSLAVTRRYVDPYGKPRGPQPAAWPDQHGYLGKATDPATGLSVLGSREYDPATGRFLSVDPAMIAGDAEQMNGYVYADDNPVSYSDPSGAMRVNPGLCGCDPSPPDPGPVNGSICNYPPFCNSSGSGSGGGGGGGTGGSWGWGGGGGGIPFPTHLGIAMPRPPSTIQKNNGIEELAVALAEEQVVAKMKQLFPRITDAEAWDMVDTESGIPGGTKSGKPVPAGARKPRGAVDVIFSTAAFASALNLPYVTFIWELKSDGGGGPALAAKRQAEAASNVQHYIKAYRAANPGAGAVVPGLPIDPGTAALPADGALTVYSPNPCVLAPDGAILYNTHDASVRNPNRAPDLSPDLGGLGFAAILGALAAAGRRGGGSRPVGQPGLAGLTPAW